MQSRRPYFGELMQTGNLDQMIAFAIEVLASGDDHRIGGLVRMMAHEFPNEPALALCFALTSAASALEDIFDEEKASADRAYRLAALVAADVLAVEAMGQTQAKTGHLLHFWRRVDPYFLNL
jgi:hypothetical protein